VTDLLNFSLFILETEVSTGTQSVGFFSTAHLQWRLMYVPSAVNWGCGSSATSVVVSLGFFWAQEPHLIAIGVLPIVKKPSLREGSPRCLTLVPLCAFLMALLTPSSLPRAQSISGSSGLNHLTFPLHPDVGQLELYQLKCETTHTSNKLT
jgi:hypothetical protein